MHSITCFCWHCQDLLGLSESPQQCGYCDRRPGAQFRTMAAYCDMGCYIAGTFAERDGLVRARCRRPAAAEGGSGVHHMCMALSTSLSCVHIFGKKSCNCSIFRFLCRGYVPLPKQHPLLSAHLVLLVVAGSTSTTMHPRACTWALQRLAYRPA